METEFKVGDKIVVVSRHTRKIGKFYNVGDIGIIKHIGSEGIIVNFNNQNNEEVYFTGVCLVRREDIRKCVEEKPRFHDAQVGDLLWNDDFGICKIKNIVDITECLFPITIRSDNGSDTITLEGKRGKNSPKATFFYYTPENHYLTERPEPQVDWAKAAGAKVKVCDLIQDKAPEEMILAFYKPELKYSFWVYDVDRDDIVYGYKYCSLAEPCKPKWRK